MDKLLKLGKKVALLLVCAAVFAVFYFLAAVHPSNSREWSPDLAVLPYAEFSGDAVTIRNVRNFSYTSVLEYTPNYYDKTYDLSKISSVDFIVEPFSGVAAHTFIAFGFEDGSYVDISVEVRREKGEFYNIFKGMLRQFELVYVIADEQDVLKLRTNHRKDHVYVYPIKTSKENMRGMFVSMLKRANKLSEKPEFYHTLFNNCTTNIVAHVNTISPNRVPWSIKYILPKYSDELAHELGLIQGEGTIDELRARHDVSTIGQTLENDPDFSVKIREAISGK